MDLITEITIFVLAAFVGFEVISKVPTTLHTPLMSQTNAIHGIVMLGGLIVIGLADDTLDKVIGTIAIVFGTINIVGGFMVTDRMLGDVRPQAESKPEASSATPPGHPGDGRTRATVDVIPLAAFSPNSDFVPVCYIVAFSLFIFGVRQGTHPTTARRGNLIAAAGHGDRGRDHPGAGRDRQRGPDRRRASLLGTLVGAVASGGCR